jgi:hyperosmotically inducible periplasmic protein
MAEQLAVQGSTGRSRPLSNPRPLTVIELARRQCAALPATSLPPHHPNLRFCLIPAEIRFHHAGILFVTTSILKRLQAFCRLQTFTWAAQLFLGGEVYMIGSGSGQETRRISMRNFLKAFVLPLGIGLLSAGLMAETTPRYDQEIQTKVTQELAQKKQFRNLQASVEDGIVTLTGNVDLYQQELDAAKKVRKTEHVQGVRNQIAVDGATVSDSTLAAKLDRGLYYDRIGYGNQFNFMTASVKDGVVTLNGVTRTEVDRDSALGLVNNTAGVKDVVNNITVAPVSFADDGIRIRAMRAIYRDPVLGRYAIDPGKPIRIVVENGKLQLYGTVDSNMDKQIAGIRAGSVFGAFSVQNNLAVAGKS